MQWQTGDTLRAGKYRIQRELGRGGFGITYLAEDVSLQRLVVIKAPNQSFSKEQDYEKFIRRFQREGQALAKIGHPNVVQAIELFQEDNLPCLVMAYIDGETLKEYIQASGPLPQEQAVATFRKLASALQQVHSAGLIHCDIHPGNIILQANGEPVLIDFGSAKLAQPSTSTLSTTVNDGYSPYEQRKGDPQPTWDIYALAATLYFAVTGHKPVPSLDRKYDGDTLKTPQQYRAALSDWLNAAILQGMAVEPKDRPPSVEDWQAWPDSRPKRSVAKPSTVQQKNGWNSQAEPRSLTELLGRGIAYLLFLTVGFGSHGVVLGLSATRVLVGIVSLFGTMSLAGGGTATRYETNSPAITLGASIGWVLSWSWVYSVTFSGVWAGIWVGGYVVQMFSVRLLRKLIGCGVIVVNAILLFLAGGIVGEVTGVGLFSGGALGLTSVMQQSFSVGGLAALSDSLKKRGYSSISAWMMLSLAATSALFLGIGLGKVLKLWGVALPAA